MSATSDINLRHPCSSWRYVGMASRYLFYLLCKAVGPIHREQVGVFSMSPVKYSKFCHLQLSRVIQMLCYVCRLGKGSLGMEGCLISWLCALQSSKCSPTKWLLVLCAAILGWEGGGLAWRYQRLPRWDRILMKWSFFVSRREQFMFLFCHLLFMMALLSRIWT